MSETLSTTNGQELMDNYSGCTVNEANASIVTYYEQFPNERHRAVIDVMLNGLSAGLCGDKNIFKDKEKQVS